jgi:hypothetical protein
MNPPSSLDERIADLKTIGPLLRSLGAFTYRDLLSISLDSLRGRSGVGSGKLKRIEDLMQEARRRAESPDTPSDKPFGDIAAQPSPRFDYDSSNPLVVLGRLPARIRSIIQEHDLRTIKTLKEWYRRVDLGGLMNFGRKSHTTLGKALEQLETSGHESMVFGGPTPCTVAGFAQRYLDHPETTDRELLELRLIQGWTLERIGQTREVTRERIRQIFETDIADARPSWGPSAEALMEPAVLLLEKGGGIALSSRLTDALGTPPVWAIELTRLLAGIDLSFNIIDGISTSLPGEEFHAIRQEVRRILADVQPLSASVVREVIANVGFTIPAEDLPEVADRMFGIGIDGEDAFPGRRSVQHLYLKALREAGGPVSAEEVARRVNALDPSISATKRNAVAHFSRVDEAYNHSTNRWIHADHIPLSREALAALAERCLPMIEKAGGKSVSMRLLLDKLVADGEAERGLTPNILRDALIHTGKVRGWCAGSDVSWREGTIHRKTIEVWLREMADQLDQPFCASELIQAVAQASGHLPSSITVAFHRPTSALVALGHGEYVSRNIVWPTEEGFRAALDKVAAAVSTLGLRSVEGPGLEIPGLEQEVARFGQDIIWGLAHLQPDIIGTRERGRLMWPADLGKNFWEVISKQFLGNHPLFKPQTLRNFLFKRGLRSEHVVYVLIKEGLEAGHIERVGLRWHIDSRTSSERRVQLLNEQEEIRQIVLGSDEFQGGSPLRDILDTVRTESGCAPTG